MEDIVAQRKGRLRKVVFCVIDQMNRNLPGDQQIDKGPSAVLAGPGGALDSLGLVELAMSIQESILEEFDIACSVIDEEAFARTESPFSTVETLVDYLEESLENVRAV